MIRAWAILIVLGLFVLLAFVFQHLDSRVTKLTTELTDTTNALKVSQKTGSGLLVRVGKLSLDSTQKAGRIATLERDQATVNADADRKQEQIRQAVSDRNKAIADMPAVQQKLAALKLAFRNGEITIARLRDSLSTMPVFTDAEANRIYLQTINERDMWRDSTEAVYKSREQIRLRAESEKKRADLAENRESDLERELNGVRSFVQDKRTEKAKGLGKIFKAGQIKVLGEVDAKIQSVQKSP